ncbi:diacylglycerol/lipid kinase family protein [Adlercreutzia faecimuris]|uniref:NAD(+)/NADH kinase n=1 Tax=Adlercreutzia faecimuris TaxID=2897341 RepID=A0ABS9WH21_9ACTN|nr:NAD(+)/NADH kinase [Adlercreutzia sp. JBNU-10]
MKLLIVNNLVSGYGEGAIYDYIRALAADGDEVVIRSTDGSTDLRRFLADAGEFDVVVASGGDGTVAAVTYLLADTGIPVLPFPAGTANLLAMNLASPSEPHALAKLTREGEIMDFDLGEIELASGERFGFSIMAGAGYDALIMQGAKPAKRLLGPMAYFTSALTNPLPQFSRFTIDIDGEVIESEGVGVLIVNFSKIQFDLPVVHQNLPRDGVFDVAILHTRDAFGLIPALLASMLDRTGDFPDRTDALELHRGRTIAVSADPPLQVQYDGEVTELTTPFTVRMLPEAARFIVSEECVRLYGPDPEGPAA